MNMKTDERLNKVETITIEWETFKKALARNYFDEDYHQMRQDRSFVLRLYPPFEATMDAQYYESEHGRHYNNEWSEKPLHMTPELFLLEGSDSWGPRQMEWPTERQVQSNLTDEEIEDEGGIEESLQIARDIFWDEVKYHRPDSIDLGIFTEGPNGYVVDIEWSDD